MKSLPNILSWLRVIIAPIFLVLFFVHSHEAKLVAIVLFFVAAITDYLDGYTARKYDATSEWGAFFDPLADKVLTSAAFVAFGILGIAPIWAVCLIILRDIFATYLRVYSDKRQIEFKTSYMAKFKTFVQMFFISFILWIIFIENMELSPDVTQMCRFIVYSSYIRYTIIAITGLTIWTLIDYLKKPSVKKEKILS